MGFLERLNEEVNENELTSREIELLDKSSDEKNVWTSNEFEEFIIAMKKEKREFLKSKRGAPSGNSKTIKERYEYFKDKAIKKYPEFDFCKRVKYIWNHPSNKDAIKYVDDMHSYPKDGLWGYYDEYAHRISFKIVKRPLTSKSYGRKGSSSSKRCVLHSIDGKIQQPQTATGSGGHLGGINLDLDIRRKVNQQKAESNRGVGRTWDEFKTHIDSKWFEIYDKNILHDNDKYAGFWFKHGMPWRKTSGNLGDKKREEIDKYLNENGVYKRRSGKYPKRVIFLKDDGSTRIVDCDDPSVKEYNMEMKDYFNNKATGKEKILEIIDELHLDINGNRKYEYTYIPKYARLGGGGLNNNNILKYICPEHKEEGEITQRIGAHVGPYASGCPYCAERKGEKAIRIKLKNMDFEPVKKAEGKNYNCFSSQESPSGLKYSKELGGGNPQLDCYGKYNGKEFMIEYHGPQHYEVSKFFGMTGESLILQNKKDQTRRIFARNEDCHYLEIGFSKLSKINYLITEFFNEIDENKGRIHKHIHKSIIEYSIDNKSMLENPAVKESIFSKLGRML